MKMTIQYPFKSMRWMQLMVVVIGLFCWVGCIKDYKDQTFITNTNLSILQTNKSNLESLLSGSTYGTAPGTYPEASKTILTAAISKIETTIKDVQAGTSSMTDTQLEQEVAAVNQAIDDFKNSRLYNLSADAQQYVTNLKAKASSYSTILNDTTKWGNHKGQYPLESKDILQSAITSLLTLAENILSGAITNMTQAQYDDAIQAAEASMKKVEDSKWAEDHLVWDLFVDGNNGGYIDFGYSPDYVNFGSDGNQSFTIELWVNVKEYCNKSGEDNSTFLSTLVNNGTWGGWRSQDRNKGLYQRSMVAYWNDQAQTTSGEWEPRITKSAGFTQNRWTHYAFVFNDKGLLGNANYKCYNMVDGVRSGDIINIGETYRTYTYASSVKYQVPMTAFCSLANDGSRNEYFSGYIKKIRIWKTSRTEDQVRSAYLDTETDATANNANLVAAWDIETLGSMPTATAIKDLTGRHTATLKGTYKWVESTTVSQ